MNKLRIGKDFTVRWSINHKVDGKKEGYDLSGRDLLLRLQSPYRTDDILDFSTEGNTVVWSFRGKDQSSLGTYGLVLVENHGKDGMLTVDKVRAFQLVAHTEDEALDRDSVVSVETVFLESEVTLTPSVVEVGRIEVDSELDADSENPVANRAIVEALAGKQETVSDLATIRANAAKGATALQAEQYKGTVTGVKVNGSTKNPSNGIVDIGTVITSHQDISGKADKSSLASVATSGSYNDLKNKPNIPSAVTESTVSGWGFTKNTGTYSKPSSGIPKSDLASAVQTSLNKADTALQTEQYKGTVTGVKINGTTKSPSSGVVDLGTVITAHQDISGKQDKITDLDDIREGAAKGAASEPYITDFTINDIDSVYYGSVNEVQYNRVALENAIGAGKIIKVPFGYENDGVVIASPFFEDIIYLNVPITGGASFEIELDSSSQDYIRKEQILLVGSGAVVDSELSETSTNPVQNAVITQNLTGMAQVLQWLSDGLAQKMDLDVNSQTESTISAMQPDNVYIIANTSAGYVKVNSIAAPVASKLMGRYTVMFTGATSLTIPSEVLWADGKVPTIDPAMHYELSIIGARFGSTVVYKAILTGFKSV